MYALFFLCLSPLNCFSNIITSINLARGVEGKACSSVTVGVCQTCICITVLGTYCITWWMSPIFFHTLLINSDIFLGLRARWVMPCQSPHAENTSRFLLKKCSWFFPERILFSNLVHFLSCYQQHQWGYNSLTTSNFDMKEWPQNFNLLKLKSRYVLSIQVLRSHLINCYYYNFHLIIVFTVARQWCWLLRLRIWFPFSPEFEQNL